MGGLSEHTIFLFVLQLGIIIFLARIFGEFAAKLGQPVMVGEVLAGVFLGPLVLGSFAPAVYSSLFPKGDVTNYLLEGISWVCILFLLIITGLEIDVSASIRHVKRNILTSLLAFVLPFLAVFVYFSYLPYPKYPPNIPSVYVDLLVATALSVAATPVIAKILFDLKILRSIVGLNILTAGVLGEIWEWSILGTVLSLIVHNSVGFSAVFKPLIVMILYIGFCLTLGRVIVDKVFTWFGVRTENTTTVLSLLFSLALLNGALAHAFGLHVIFGAFVAGIMAGESHRITPYMRQSIQDLILSVFAPIFFVLIGMKLYLQGADQWLYMFLLLIVSSFFKVLGGHLGALLGGMGKRNAFAVGCGLNTQGTTGIIIALIGRELGVFPDELFSLIVVISILTALIVGPTLKWAIQDMRRPLAKFFAAKNVFLDVVGQTKEEVITNIASLLAERNIVQDENMIREAIWEREKLMTTAIGDGVAIPHARLPNLKVPILGFFRLRHPVDFNSPDNKPVQIVFLELTDRDDDGMQLNIVSQIAHFLASPHSIRRLLQCQREEDVYHVLSFDEKK
ncbi:MAG: hypothetical protein A2Z88_04395 [Omnitrophica WOR_2 bacterium GWA2_47_8]|nr:MAG: hypothetical protein A2Z88_04395 [Omnitrophica WOR_2 bacterium GWA2_47_8]